MKILTQINRAGNPKSNITSEDHHNSTLLSGIRRSSENSQSFLEIEEHRKRGIGWFSFGFEIALWEVITGKTLFEGDQCEGWLRWFWVWVSPSQGLEIPISDVVGALFFNVGMGLLRGVTGSSCLFST